ncbi:Chorismate_bind domain-containing protein [Cephalotus follicularis]|uniref:Chorismate_bind domain-containing protein n=1 Tax=Cephalotus follicularis TaxID=3775 RepID=A0A1Q3AUK3_CEPFO|nr:Chorismate_bind domain-containing protein [Cephalotus follicularis]
MLVDLGRNDVGKVSKSGSVKVEKLMNVERYSHVKHISSTVTGELLDNLTCWDALRAALPVGTASGAPKVVEKAVAKAIFSRRWTTRTWHTYQGFNTCIPSLQSSFLIMYYLCFYRSVLVLF